MINVVSRKFIILFVSLVTASNIVMAGVRELPGEIVSVSVEGSSVVFQSKQDGRVSYRVPANASIRLKDGSLGALNNLRIGDLVVIVESENSAAELEQIAVFGNDASLITE